MLIRPALSPSMLMRLGVGITNTTLRVTLMTMKNNPTGLCSHQLLGKFNNTTKFQKMATLTTTSSRRATVSGISPLLVGSNSNTGATAISLRSLSFAGMRLHQQSLSNNINSHSLSPMLPLGSVAYFSSSGGSRGGPPKGGGRMGWAGGALGIGALLLGKGKYILGALKIGKLSTMASMILSVGAYSMVFGLPYAAGMVGLIFVHETGHLIAMRHYGIPFSPMVFLPFMGAVIAMKSHPKDAWQDAIIAFGGPVLGSAGAGVIAVGAAMTDSQLLYALADFGFMINLFNMLPIGDMDGGRIAGACSPYAGVVGLGIGGSMIASGAISNPLIYIIMAVGGYSTFMRFYDPNAHKPPNYYRITDSQRTLIGVGYFGLIGAMATGMAINGINKKSPEEIQRYQELHFDERY